MGYKPEDRTVNLESDAKRQDFQPRLPEGVQRVRIGSTPAQDQRRKLPVGKP